MPRDIALTLAGGGNRAFFQAGLLRHWWERLEPRVAVISSCSAGSSMAVSLMTGREREATAFWYRRIRTSCERLLRWGSRSSSSVGAPAEPAPPGGESGTAARGGSSTARARGQNQHRHTFDCGLHECGSIDAVIDVVVASSATPPFTPLGRHNGSALLDGGLVDNAPAFVAERMQGIRKHLVILTRPYPAASVGMQGGRWYLCPCEPVPINRWEYTRPDLVEATIALGEREALRRDGELEALLNGD